VWKGSEPIFKFGLRRIKKLESGLAGSFGERFFVYFFISGKSKCSLLSKEVVVNARSLFFIMQIFFTWIYAL